MGETIIYGRTNVIKGSKSWALARNSSIHMVK